MLSSFWNDLRYAARTLSRSPGFAAAAIVTISLGIGVNAGIFTILNGVLFRDVPAPDAHELVSIQQTVANGQLTATTGVGTFSASEYRAYRDRARTLAGVAAHSNPASTTLGGEVPQHLYGVIVSCNYFAVLRQPPALGRALTEQDCAPGAAPVVVLGRQLWTTTFAADPAILGRSVELNRQLFTVVGVASEGTYGGSPMLTGFFAPISADPLLGPAATRSQDDKFLWLYLIGRRSDRAGVEQVRAELAVIAAQIDQQQPGRSTRLTIERATQMSVPAGSRGAATGAAAVLMAAFGLILLIACANVANLLLARGTAKSRDIGIRLSLGASRARVVRLLLTESLLISIAGGLLGSVLAVWSFPLAALVLPSALPPEVPTFASALDFSPDVRVLSFAMALTLGTGILFGLAPALHVSRPDVLSVIRQDSAVTGSNRGGGRLRGTLVGVQVAMSMALMIAAGLLLRGLYATYTVDPGFVHRDVAYVFFGLDGLPYEADAAAIFRQRLRDQVAALPGVDAVAFASDPPLGEETAGIQIRLQGESEKQNRIADLNGVTSGYFSLLGIPIVRGRTFTEAETVNAAPRGTGTGPVIVSETTARNLWPDGDPIGRTLLTRDGTLQVVGVAADAQVTTLGAIAPYFVYVPGGEKLLVKSRIDFGATVSSIHRIVRALDPALVVRVLPLEANLGWVRSVSATVAILGAGLGVLALVLASVGIYGVVSYAVTRRYREIGIRMALGASVGTVLGMILRQAMRPVAIGAVIGIAAAGALSRVLSSVLFGVSPADPLGLGGAALLVFGVALAASAIAARPATRADPTAALRYE
jgi:predicted permease